MADIMKRGLHLAVLGLWLGLLWAFPAVAQTPAASGQEPPQTNAPKETPEADLAEDVEALRQRVEQLEAHIVDLRAMIGTLKSLMGTRTAAALPSPDTPGLPNGPGTPASGEDTSVLELQISALARQMEEVLRRVQALERGRVVAPTGDGGKKDDYVAGSPAVPAAVPADVPGAGAATVPGAGAANPAPPPPVSGFGTVTIEPGSTTEAETPSPPREDPAAVARRLVDPYADSEADPRELYREGYGHLLRRDFAAAEKAFRAFLQRYPEHELAGNAQYWIGETYFARNQYKKAADAFLKGYRNYKKGLKAPDSLLKLALSLRALGQKKAACATFAELAARYPLAPNHVKQRAATEKRRTGC